jgi:hypothetical protein
VATGDDQVPVEQESRAHIGTMAHH